MWRILGAVLVASTIPSLACASNPSRQDQERVDTGVMGQVLRGPVAPGPERVGSADEEPFSALFHVLNGNEVEVTSFESDEEGRFEVALAPGNYIVVPDESAPILFPTRQRREVTAPEEGYVEVVLRFDTGLR